MPHDVEDNFPYETLYVSKKNKQNSANSDGGYIPLGSGRKSEFAIGVEKKETDVPTEESNPKPNDKEPVQEKSGAKKKSASAGSSNKSKKKPASKHAAKSPAKQSKAASEEPTEPAKPKKKSAAKKFDEKSSDSKKPAAKKPDDKSSDSKKSAAKKPASKKRKAQTKAKSGRENILFYVYFGVMTVGGGLKKAFGSRRNRIVTASLIVVALMICCAVGVMSVYSSKTLFSDEGKELDETAIQERIITDEQNRDKVTYFLIVGVDKSQMLTDCIWIMCFDNMAHKINVMQIPRDTYVGEDSKAVGKINGVYKTPKTAKWCEKCGKEVFDDEIEAGVHTVCGGKITKRTESKINALIRVINTRLSLPVDHYVLFDFEGFEKVIDAIGGVDILLEEEMKVYPNKNEYITLPAGMNHLDGETALKFMRTRKNYANGDLGRVRGQRKVIRAMLEKVDKMTSIEALKALKAAYGDFKTDMSLEEIRSFIAPVKKCGADSLHMFELPGSDYWVKHHPSYYICDEEKAAEEINQYLLPYSQKITAYNISFPDLGY